MKCDIYEKHVKSLTVLFSYWVLTIMELDKSTDKYKLYMKYKRWIENIVSRVVKPTTYISIYNKHTSFI